MATLYAIPCTFKLTEQSETEYGLAICSDPDTPVTFIHQNGSPVIEDILWTYRLMHYSPWAKLEMP
jgi:hypothetical protein